ncbi:MAG: cytochrome c-type biogenesis protein CcmH [Acidobacteriota bacterium]|nr:cytochrome c-type biogenesis protein CcmH [Acidobacteriota bacterium]
MILAFLILLTTATVPDAEQLVGAPLGTPLQGEALTQRTQEIAALIRCPVCQGLSVADSPSEMAVNMKAQVRAMLERGFTRAQIESYFVRAYGEFVLLEPKFEGVNALVWILPIVALAAGAFVVAMKLRKLSNAPPSKPRVSASDPQLARVRELVKGATQ